MINIKIIREWNNNIIDRLISRGVSRETLEEIHNLDIKKRKLQSEVDEIKFFKNKESKKIGYLVREGQYDEVNKIKGIIVQKNIDLNVLELKFKELETKISAMLKIIPNIPHESSPVGKSEEENVEIYRYGVPRKFAYAPKAHHDLLGALDADRGAKLAGARFVVLKNETAKLERALMNFMLDQACTNGYTEVAVPAIVNSEMLFGTGQLPKFKEDLFKIEGHDKYLIPTAEVPLTNLFNNEIITEKQLPIYLTAHTPCFRSEAGSAGKDSKGLIRLHQFQKIELVKFVKSECGIEELNKLTKNAMKILEELELPYRVLELCTGDLGFSSSKTYDLEVWFPSQNTYREISSCSLMGDFQARRANIRVKDNGQSQYVSTLNGSGLAIGRTIAAILENYQKEDGTFNVPKVLKEYYR